MLPERLAALAVERQAGRVHEHGREIGEQVTPAIEQLLLDDVLDAARRQSPLRLLFHLFTEPRHRPIEMVEVETIDAGNVVNTGGDPTSTLLQNCASSPGKYPDSKKFFLLTSSSQILTVFTQIGTELSQLRIAK